MDYDLSLRPKTLKLPHENREETLEEEYTHTGKTS